MKNLDFLKHKLYKNSSEIFINKKFRKKLKFFEIVEILEKNSKMEKYQIEKILENNNILKNEKYDIKKIKKKFFLNFNENKIILEIISKNAGKNFLLKNFFLNFQQIYNFENLEKIFEKMKLSNFEKESIFFF